MRKVKEMLHHNRAPATSSTGYNSYDQNVMPSASQTYSYPSSSTTQPGTGNFAQPLEGPALGSGNFANSGYNNAGFGNSGMQSYIHPLVLQQQSLPANIASWQPGQPVPQGWRLGRKGFIKPMWSLPSHLSSWQQGQPIPEGYRLGKSGLRPTHYSWMSSSSSSMGSSYATTNVLPARIEVREKPAVVQEVIKPGVREEIQPVIHRQREQLEIREEVQPIYEKTVRGTIFEERQLAPEMRPEVRMGQMPVLAEGPRSSVFVENEQRQMFVNAPIVEEVVHKKIVEEIQPVIHREVIAPRIIRETQPIFEKVVEAPIVSYTTLAPRYVGESTQFSSYNNTNFGNSFGSISGWQPGQALPAHILNWQQGQPIPQGWRLGRKGYLKPSYTLPSHLSSWQQGQPVPQGYRLGKGGMLKPQFLHNFGQYYNGNKFQQQQGNSAFIPNTVQRF